MTNHTYIIAEAGVNHNGDINLAYKLIDAAKFANADCVKFQTWITENDIIKNCEKAEYQKQTNDKETQFDLIKKLELSFDDFKKLKKYCDRIGITFVSTPFDLDSLNFLNTLDLPFWKISSSEVQNYPLLKAIGKTKKNVIMSTGMCNENDIHSAIEVLKTFGTKKIKLLHCNTEYPTPYNDVNLKTIQTLKDKFHVEVGYSDHTLGIEIPIAAVAMGAQIIEKHFTLDKNMEGPDHKASLEPNELKQMVQSIRNIEKAIGDGHKRITPSEKRNLITARKSIVAKTNIKKGETFTEENLTTKRPGNGISPMRWDEIIGTVAVKDFKEDELICEK